MAFVRGFFRVYSWIFEAILGLMGIALGVGPLIVGIHSVQLGWLPWTGSSLTLWPILLGLLALMLVLLAVAGRMRWLLFLFSIGVFVLFLRGFFLGSYSFAGPLQARHAAILTAGALLAALGAWPSNSRANSRVR